MLGAVRAGKAERERGPASPMSGQAAEVREAVPAGLAAQRVHGSGRPPVEEWAVVDGGRAGQAESVAPRRRPGGFELDDGLEAERAGTHVRAL
jgi:hypothetical protein